MLQNGTNPPWFCSLFFALLSSFYRCIFGFVPFCTLDYISSHQDNEKQIVENSPIVSISFGQERVFRIRDSNKKIILDTKTEDASFVVMCGEFQKHFWHEIPKVTGKKGES